MTQQVKIALGMVIVLVALLSVVSLAHAGLSLAHAGPFAGGGDECAMPLSERTAGWGCYEPDGR